MKEPIKGDYEMASVQIKPSTIGIAALATLVAGGLIGARFFKTKRVSTAERMTEALLNTETLKSGLTALPDHSEKLLASCADYFVNMCRNAAEGVGMSNGQSDPQGHTRLHSHKFTGAVASLITESIAPEQVLSYNVLIPGVGEVSGTRNVGGIRISGIFPVYPTPETAQVQLEGGYTAQLESALDVTDALLTGKARIQGSVMLRDNFGNVGRLNVASDESITGTITRDSRIVGRFEGNLSNRLRFTPYQIEG